MRISILTIIIVVCIAMAKAENPCHVMDDAEKFITLKESKFEEKTSLSIDIVSVDETDCSAALFNHNRWFNSYLITHCKERPDYHALFAEPNTLKRKAIYLE